MPHAGPCLARLADGIAAFGRRMAAGRARARLSPVMRVRVPRVLSPKEAVDIINQRFGSHGARALHAKGTLLEGTFTATPAAARLTRAAHMQGEPVKATVRFSNGSGDPDAPDYGPEIRGMAAKLYLPDGETRTDISAQTVPRFPVRTP